MRRIPYALSLVLAAALAACGGSTTQVVVPVAITVSPHDTAIGLGKTAQLTVTVTDAQGNPISNVPLTYVSVDTAVATVSSSGLVSAGVRTGTTYVRVSLFALEDSALITVVDSSVIAHLAMTGGPFAAGVSSQGAAFVGLLNSAVVTRIDLASDSAGVSVPVGSTPSRIAFDASGTTAYVSNQGSNTVSVIDVATNTATKTISVHGHPVPLAASANDQWLYVATDLNQLYKISLSTGQATDSIPLPQTSHFMLLAPNDTTLYVSTRDAGVVLEVNVWTWQAVRAFTLGGLVQGMALSPDGSELYVANETAQRLDVVNLATGTPVSSVQLDAPGFDVVRSADGSKLYVSLLLGGEVEVLDRATRKVDKIVAVGGSPACMGVDPTSGVVMVANQGGWVDFLR